MNNLRDDIREATLARNTFKVNLLKYILGEYERAALANKNTSLEKIIEKTIENNNICFQARPEQKYTQENEILQAYLPKYLTLDELFTELAPLGLSNSKQSVGVAIKHLKSKQLPFRNEDVVKTINNICSVV